MEDIEMAEKAEILYSDEDLIISVKPVGILSQGDEKNSDNMLSYLKEISKCEIYPVHRLDRNVGGVMVFAKSLKGARSLSEIVSDKNKFLKEYVLITEGLCDKEGIMKDFLYKSKEGKAYVVKKERKGVKEAVLSYSRLDISESEKNIKSLVKVRLDTGRFHQIRAQFASRKLPLCGDGKYGGRDNKCEIALWSHRIKFKHPFLGKELDFKSKPENKYPWNLFEDQLKNL